MGVGRLRMSVVELVSDCQAYQGYNGEAYDELVAEIGNCVEKNESPTGYLRKPRFGITNGTHTQQYITVNKIRQSTARNNTL